VASLIEALNISSSPILNAVISILVFFVIAKGVDIFIDKGLRKIARRTSMALDDRIIDTIHRPVYYTIVLVGVLLAVEYLGPTEKAGLYARGTLYSLIAVIWTFTVIRINNALVESAFSKGADVTGLSKDLLPLVENILKIAVFVVAVAVILSVWKINVTPLLASAGIVGVGLAIAAKDTVSNLFGGISVFLDRPFKVGDYIVLDQGERGEVVAIGLRSTRIRTRDHIQIGVPNAIIANSKIINESAPIPNFRVRIPVNVAYGSDIDLVEKTLIEVAGGNGNVVSEPEPRVRFRQFGDSALMFELLCWATEPAVRGRTMHEINCAIYRKFKELEITIPFPQRDVHIIPRERENSDSASSGPERGRFS
jgi:small-conductance mechanosensitive channel